MQQKKKKDAAKSKVDEEVTKEKRDRSSFLQIVMLIRSKIKVQMALIVL